MLRYLSDYPAGRSGTALLLLRFIAGLAFIFHGLPKVKDVGAFAGMLHLPPFLAAIAAYTEVIGGALLILGLLTPLAALFIAVEMLVALFTVHLPAHDPFVNPAGRSCELAAVYLFVMAALLLTGPGAFSVDAMMFRRLTGAETAPERLQRDRLAA